MMRGVDTMVLMKLWERFHRDIATLMLAITALLASGCASIDPYNIIGRRVPISSVEQSAYATPAVRKAAIDAVWTTVNDHYYRADLNGVDWRAARDKWQPLAMAAATDDEFWERLDQMAGELADVHTRVESPKAVAQRKEQQVLSLGLNIRLLNDALVVLSVNPESDAYWSGVRAGMRLLRIDGEDAQAQWQMWAQGMPSGEPSMMTSRLDSLSS